MWKKEKCWLSAFPFFPTMFSKDFHLKVIKTCVESVKNLQADTHSREKALIEIKCSFKLLA